MVRAHADEAETKAELSTGVGPRAGAEACYNAEANMET